MAHVLDDESEARFVALANAAGQHSLWPASLTVPGGWTTVYGPAERRSCLHHVNRSWYDVRTVAQAEEATGYAGVPGLIAARVAAAPDAVAVSCATSSLTYRELDEISNGYAHWLVANGLGGAVVPIMMPRSVELIALLLGVLKCGSAYLVLDADDPAARRAHLVRACDATSVVVAAPPQAPSPDSLPVLVLPSRDAKLDTTPVSIALTPETPAYTSFTSGSTGEPRGVVVPHRAIVRLVQSPSWITVRPDDVVLQCAPISFDASTFEIWAALASGARLAVYAAERLELGELASTLRTESVSVLWLTAGLFHRMAASHLPAFGGLRVLLAGGDVVSPHHVAAVLAAHPGLTFINGYGPTENTTFTACWSTTEGTGGVGEVPIGYPIDGTGIEILDEELKPLPAGAVGELWTYGDGLALGYLGRPDATAERFVAHPRADRPGARMYRTGDLVRLRADGALDFLGRADGQVKVNGFRVDTTAIEHAIEAHPEVAGAAVISQTTEAGDAQLIAYVTMADALAERSATTPATARAALPSSLRRWLGSQLPSYCVPFAVRVLDELPLNANGKVDRRALPAAKLQQRNVWNDYVSPGDELECLLANVWGEVLGIEPVGVQDDFFDLGGHSLLAADLIGRLQRDHKIDLRARMLYLQPTIAAIADSLRTPSAATVRTELEHACIS